ncbi:hypothetical protein A9Q97_04910 [Rhodospirillales bacterium 47_12_T64]|nr:hypothetical protein A9Q97_04910 [Rhodospirillales bacterium 47_12_T64]
MFRTKATNSNAQELVEIIKLYTKSVLPLSSKLSNLLKIEKLSDWRSLKAPIKDDFSDNDLSYYFHGSGCCITSSTMVVDFEFDLDCSIGGFDAWRIWSFINNNENIASSFPHFNSIRIVEEYFASLIQSGLIIQKCTKSLYWEKVSIEEL